MVWGFYIGIQRGRKLCRAVRMGHLHTLAVLLHGILAPGAIGAVTRGADLGLR